MQQFRIKRNITSIAYAAGQSVPFEMPRGNDYESLTLRLSGSLVVTAAGAAVRSEAPAQLVPRIEITSDGRNSIYSAPFWYGAYAHHDLAPNSQQAQNISVPPTAAAIATYPVEATSVISFNIPDGERQKDSNLVTIGMSLFTLRLTFGQPTDVLTGAPAATFIGSVDVLSSEIVESVDPATGKRTMPSAFRKTTLLEQLVAATTANHEILLPAGNLIKSVMLRSEGALTAGEPGTGVLNNVQLVSNTDVRVSMKAAALRAENAHLFGWLKNGYYVIDLSRNAGLARLTELWDVTQQAQPKVISDVTVGAATTKIQAVVTEFLKA